MAEREAANTEPRVRVHPSDIGLVERTNALALSTGLTDSKPRVGARAPRLPGEVAERPMPIRGRRPPCRLRDSGCPQPIRVARPRKCAQALPP